jgi:hypothetical protein
MNKKTIKTFLTAVMAVLAFPSFLFSQEGEALKWGGYVKVDMFNDSRAVVAARDDMLALYPAERKQITDAPASFKEHSWYRCCYSLCICKQRGS